jgi:hypothetical protein
MVLSHQHQYQKQHQHQYQQQEVIILNTTPKKSNTTSTNNTNNRLSSANVQQQSYNNNTNHYPTTTTMMMMMIYHYKRQWYILTIFIFVLLIGFLLEQQLLTNVKYNIMLEQQEQKLNLNRITFLQQQHTNQNQQQQISRIITSSVEAESSSVSETIVYNTTSNNNDNDTGNSSNINITITNTTVQGMIESLQSMILRIKNEKKQQQQQQQQASNTNVDTYDEEQLFINEIQLLLSNFDPNNNNNSNSTFLMNTTGIILHLQQEQDRDESINNSDNNQQIATTKNEEEKMYYEQQQQQHYHHQNHPTETDHTTVHILYGLSGNETGFLHELEVSLKSVLLNAPYHAAMVIHIMADQIAYDSLSDTILYTNRTNYIYKWRTNQPISIYTYNIESYIPQWKTFIQTATNYSIDEQTQDHTIGTYFRLFAHQVLPIDTIKYVLYLDTDVVIMANLDNVWSYTTTIPPKANNTQQRLLSKKKSTNINSTTMTITTTNESFETNETPSNDTEPYFLWGLSECAGFVILNLQKLDIIWELISQMDLNMLSEIEDDWISDQFVLRMINKTYPELVGVLPEQWDVSIAAKSKLWRGNLVDRRPDGVGMLHFNGGKSTTTSAYNTSNFILYDKFRHSWGIANYYVYLPWNWVQFIIESRINPYPDNNSDSSTNNNDDSDTTPGPTKKRTNTRGRIKERHSNTPNKTTIRMGIRYEYSINQQ